MRRLLGIACLLASACASVVTAPPYLPQLRPREDLALPAHPRSYQPSGNGLIARFELERARASPHANVYADALRHLSPLHGILSDMGWDLATDVDRALVLAPSISSQDAIFVLRIHQSREQAMEQLRAAWAGRGHELACTESAGFTICAWPPHGEIDRAVIFTCEHEVVVASTWRMPEILEVARDHRARRTEGDEVIEPLLREPLTALAQLHALRPPWFGDPRPQSSNVAVHELADHRLAIVLESTFDGENDAIEARADAEEIVNVYLHEPILSGVARLLALVRVTQEGDRMTMTAEYGDQELNLLVALTSLIGY